MTDDQEQPSDSLARRLERSVTVKTAAAVLGKHPQTIRRWIQNGTLEAFALGHRELRVTRASLQRFTDDTGISEDPVPAVPAVPRRPAGGLYDPDWGLFDGAPFAGAAGAVVDARAPDPGLKRGS